ncbi:MAG: type I DNA topoisomerase [Anaerolineae bacterium]|nr:type I DNA topoisomerase [Anaerolineae bacterium]
MGATPEHAGIEKPAPTSRPKSSKKASKKTSKSTRKTKAVSKLTPESTTPAHRRGKLVIVESPAKARSVSHFLGKGFTVKASKGHVRDLLVTQLSVDVRNDFEPKYRVPNDKRDVVNDLVAAVNKSSEVYLATDPDREGEAIAWHLMEVTNLEEKRVKRVVFHEITQPAVEDAFAHPRQLDMSLVNAQQARRILDRLVGYNITELLWQKVRNQLSAGRVQSIALRLIVDREAEIEVFVPQEYWTLDAELKKQHGKDSNRPFVARLVKFQGQDVDFHKEADIQRHLPVLKKSQYVVSDVKHGTRQRKPSAPFTTSTLQQESSRRLGYTARRTMGIAQQLYEGIDIGGSSGAIGLITYMRTDSTQVSELAQNEARAFIHERFGEKFHPPKPPRYQTKTKGAQEAHEAIRPTSVYRDPESLKSVLSRDQFRVYKLIWERFLASQMSSAIYNTLRVEIAAGETDAKRPYTFRVSGSTIKFMGFLALYEDARDEDLVPDEDEGRILPELAVGEVLDLLKLLPEQHFTQPPPRYTEASLVRTLEEFGIGRPSTYATTVATIEDREYIQKQDKRLVPTDTGKTVSELLVQYFPEIINYQFTAKMEDQLDTIAEGHLEWRPMLREFYTPFEQQLQRARTEIPRVRQEETIGRDCPESGHPLVIRYGRYGKFVGCSNYPECRYTEPWLDRISIACPVCGKTHGGEIIARKTRKGRTFYGCSRYPECEFTSWKRPLPQPCPNCGGLLIEQSRNSAQCTVCQHRFPVNELTEKIPSAEPV